MTSSRAHRLAATALARILLLHASLPRNANTALAFSASSSPPPRGPTPIDGAGWPDRFPAQSHCSKCGLCETTFVTNVNDACAFLGEGMGRIDAMEGQVHGRGRDLDDAAWTDVGGGGAPPAPAADEARFGVLAQPIALARGVGIEGAQWTGCVTSVALSMLESGMVDAVVCIASGEGGDGVSSWSEPEPILARTAEEVLKGRGVKPALAPSLKVLDDIRSDKSIRRLLFCGVGCAVQAFRAVQDSLDLKDVYVLGTNCVDNSPTPQAARNFLAKGVQVDETKARGYEFMQDFKVHVKMDDDYIKKPYFCLPGSIAEAAIADSCLACFDYTNALADVVVGYMGAPLAGSGKMNESYQTLTVRNSRGIEMVRAAVDAGRLQIGEEATGSGSHEKISTATVASDSIVQAMVGGEVKTEGMPRFLGEVMAIVLRNIGPKGIGFARYSIDYHLLRNYLHVLDEWGEDRAEESMPQYAKDIVDRYLDQDESFAKLRDTILTKRSKAAV